MRTIKVFAFIISFLMLSQSVHTLETGRYWMKIRAKNKFERSVIADTGVAIEATREDYVYAIGQIEEKEQIEKLGMLEMSYALTELTDFPVKDQDYHNYAELTDELQKLAKQYSSIAKLSSIGKTVENRDIWAMRISGKLTRANNLPAVIFMGGHHAREHLSVETPLRIMKWILEEYQKNNPRVRTLVNSRDIHFIPAVNADGLEFDVATGNYKLWRKNRSRNNNGTYGVDLNRNYGFGWGTGGSSTSPSSDVYMGPKPFSEPETTAIKNYVEAHSNITILLSFHTFSELILYPWGHKYDGIEVEKDRLVHETMAKKMATWNKYTPEQSSDLYIASGDTTDWSYGTLKIFSFTFELDPTNQMGTGGFYPGAKIIPEVVRKNTEPVLYLLEHADNPYRVLEPKYFPTL